MELKYFKGKDIDKGVVIFNLNSIYSNLKVLEYFKLVQYEYRNKYSIKEANIQSYLPTILKPISAKSQKCFINKEFNVPVLKNENINVFKEYDRYFNNTIEVQEIVFKRIIEEIEGKKEIINDKLREIFPELDTLIKSINIYISNYGKIGSYCYNKGTLSMYIRSDTNIKTYVELLILTLLHQSKYKNWIDSQKDFFESNNWETMINIKDFLISSGYFKDIIKKDITKQVIRVKQNIKLLKLLGISLKNDYRIDKNNIVINCTSIKGLNNHEYKLLHLLSTDQGNYFNIDNISECIWENSVNIKYSISYIPKLIFSIRKKLEFNNINPNILENKSKYGYRLV